MPSKWSAYETVITDLLSQREKIDAAIEAIKAIRPSDDNTELATTSSVGSIYRPSGRFVGMTIVEASMLVMEEAGGPIHVADLTNKITAGGVIITGDAPNTVGSVLNRRAKEKGDVQRIGRGTWAISSPAMNLKNAEEDHPVVDGEAPRTSEDKGDSVGGPRPQPIRGGWVD